MATVYKIEIEATSPWVNFHEDYIKEMIEKFLKEHKDYKDRKGFENIEVKVERKA